MGHRKKMLSWEIKTGWNNGIRSWWDSSLFDTWLRSHAIAEISTIIEDVECINNDWKFLDVPGLGWFDIRKLSVGNRA